MREPAFWFRPSSRIPLLLKPISALYGAIAARRLARAGTHADVPVICIGNYHVGGAGKTPTVIAVAGLLEELGERPFVLSRGYGGTQHGPLRVDAAGHRASEVGDEPLMMARHLPVVIAHDRVAGAAFAVAAGASVILMDDGFQNPSLVKDAALIVIDAARGLGNGCVFPAGPLRAPLAPQIARTDVLLMIGSGVAANRVAAQVLAQRKGVLRAQIRPDPVAMQHVAGRRVLAFAGIGDPDRFFATLRAAGVEVVSERRFADHHRYSAAEIAALIDQADRDGLVLLTTEKDMARLRSDPATAASAGRIAVLPISLAFEDPARMLALLGEILARRRSRTR